MTTQIATWIWFGGALCTATHILGSEYVTRVAVPHANVPTFVKLVFFFLVAALFWPMTIFGPLTRKIMLRWNLEGAREYACPECGVRSMARTQFEGRCEIIDPPSGWELLINEHGVSICCSAECAKARHFHEREGNLIGSKMPDLVCIVGNPLEHDYHRIAVELDQAGHVVLFNPHVEQPTTSEADREAAERAARLRQWKIAICDELFIVNPDRTLTPEMHWDLEMAVRFGRRVRLLRPPPEAP